MGYRGFHPCGVRKAHCDPRSVAETRCLRPGGVAEVKLPAVGEPQVLARKGLGIQTAEYGRKKKDENTGNKNLPINCKVMHFYPLIIIGLHHRPCI